VEGAALAAKVGDEAREAIELRDDKHVASADKVERGV
jgi:hypothetical protein